MTVFVEQPLDFPMSAKKVWLPKGDKKDLGRTYKTFAGATRRSAYFLVLLEAKETLVASFSSTPDSSVWFLACRENTMKTQSIFVHVFKQGTLQEYGPATFTEYHIC